MNYGYALGPDRSGGVTLDPTDEPDRLCIQLYEHTIGDAELRQKDVLEVGSGRGGGAAFVSRYHQPRSMTGVDFSRRAVQLCRRHRRGPGLSFVRGDALALPFPDASFDFVLNIESSHCYGSMEVFLSEVHRVLRPGGALLFADLRDQEGVQVLRHQFGSSRLHVDHESDITANVLTALRLDNARKLHLVDSLIPRPFRRPVRVFAGIEGTRNFTGFERGRLTYLSARLTKPAVPPVHP